MHVDPSIAEAPVHNPTMMPKGLSACEQKIESTPGHVYTQRESIY